MAKKIYNLEICFNTDTEELEYVLKKTDKAAADNASMSWDFTTLGEYFDDETLRLFEESVICLEEIPEA